MKDKKQQETYDLIRNKCKDNRKEKKITLRELAEKYSIQYCDMYAFEYGRNNSATILYVYIQEGLFWIS